MTLNNAPAPKQKGFEKTPIVGIVKVCVMPDIVDHEKVGGESLRLIICEAETQKEKTIFLDMGNRSDKGWKEQEICLDNGAVVNVWMAPWYAEYTSLKQACEKAGIQLLEDIERRPVDEIEEGQTLIEIYRVITEKGALSLIDQPIDIGVREAKPRDDGKEYPPSYFVKSVGKPQAKTNYAAGMTQAPVAKPSDKRKKTEGNAAPESLSSEVKKYIEFLVGKYGLEGVGRKLLTTNLSKYTAWGAAGKAQFATANSEKNNDNLSKELNKMLDASVLVTREDGSLYIQE